MTHNLNTLQNGSIIAFDLEVQKNIDFDRFTFKE